MPALQLGLRLHGCGGAVSGAGDLALGVDAEQVHQR
jgi:hypothetical protein